MLGFTEGTGNIVVPKPTRPDNPFGEGPGTLSSVTASAAAAPNLTNALRSERMWDAREKFFRKVLGRAGPGHWEDCLVQAARVDRLSKGRGFGDAWVELERLLVMIAQPNAMLRAAG